MLPFENRFSWELEGLISAWTSFRFDAMVCGDPSSNHLISPQTVALTLNISSYTAKYLRTCEPVALRVETATRGKLRNVLHRSSLRSCKPSRPGPGANRRGNCLRSRSNIGPTALRVIGYRGPLTSSRVLLPSSQWASTGGGWNISVAVIKPGFFLVPLPSPLAS